MRSRARTGRRGLRIALAWCVAVIWAFPLLYMLLTSFKTEADAVPPSLWLAHPTLQNYAREEAEVVGRVPPATPAAPILSGDHTGRERKDSLCA